MGEGEDDERQNLSLRVEEPGQGNPPDVANAEDNRRPEDCAPRVTFFDPASGGDGEEEVDDGGHGGEQTDLQA